MQVKNFQGYPNQFVINDGRGEFFQSYQSIVGLKTDKGFYFSADHDYSRTTSKHLGNWCGYRMERRRQGIKSGEFGVIDVCTGKIIKEIGEGK